MNNLIIFGHTITELFCLSFACGIIVFVVVELTTKEEDKDE